MKNTIEAQVGYVVRTKVLKKTGQKVKCLYDGDTPLFYVFDIMNMEWHKEEFKGNEMYHICEVFTTVKGNQFIYARDEETDEDFLVRVNEK